MRPNTESGEDPQVTDEASNLEEVERRVREIQNRKRSRIRWQISKHTAELAIDALEVRDKPPPRRGKQRRRKRNKRLL